MYQYKIEWTHKLTNECLWSTGMFQLSQFVTYMKTVSSVFVLKPTIESHTFIK